MNSVQVALRCLAVALLVLGWQLSPTMGQRGGGSTKPYVIIDLPGPYHQADGNYSYVRAEVIGDPSPDGIVNILGAEMNAGEPILWRIDAARNVSTFDLSLLVGSAYDVNSAGVIAAKLDGRPVLLLSDFTRIELAGGTNTGYVHGLSNPNTAGVFRVVGSVETEASEPRTVVWNVASNGTILSERELRSADGLPFHAQDVNDSGVMAGIQVVDGIPVAARGILDGMGNLQLTFLANPDPSEIVGYWGMQIDSAGNVLGFGYQNSPNWPYATWSRAVIWPAAGPVVDLGTKSGITSTEGNGIATVNGVMQVIGRAEDDGRAAFAYRYMDGKLQDLNTLASGDQPWSLQIGGGVNRAGVICGQGRVGRKSVQWHGFLLWPR